MQTGICYWFGYEIHNEDRFKMIRAAGFDNVMLWWGDEFENTNGPKEKLPDMARRHGLKVENAHLPYTGVGHLWDNSIHTNDIVQRYTRGILGCSSHSIKTAVIHVTDENTPPPNQSGMDRFKYLLEIAEKNDVTLAIENIRTIEHLDYIYSALNSKKIKFCFDSGHQNCFTKGQNLIERYGDRLIALHLHDNDGVSDQHKIPGKGKINWPELAENLKNTLYKGSVSLEVTKEFTPEYRNATPEKFLGDAFSQAQKIIQEIQH